VIRILIVDDHTIVRRGLKQILADHADLVVAGEAADAAQALEQVRSQRWDVVVLDVSLPDRSGLDLLQQIRFESPALPVLILSMHAEEQYALRALRLGAAGYLLKDGAPEELVAAIRTVARGGKFLSPSLAEKLAFDLADGRQQQPHERLSQREYQVFTLLASGRTVGEVADLLSLSVKTVSTHRARILEKMRLSNNAQLMIYAVQNRLV
jgi:two-component system, NarL family, invasion response regulator UvrY